MNTDIVDNEQCSVTITTVNADGERGLTVEFVKYFFYIEYHNDQQLLINGIG